MGTLLQDLRYGLRTLWNNPGFTLVALLALALGIGATSAIYTVVDAVLLRPLPFPQPEQLVVVQSMLRGQPGPSSSPDAVDFAKRNHTFDGIAFFSYDSVVLTGGSDPVHVAGLAATPNLFRVLRTTPTLGRAFADDEAHAGSQVTVISHRLWQRRYNGDPGVVGKTLSINGQPFTIIGVAPATFHFPLDAGDEPQLYLPYPRSDSEVKDAQNRGAHFLQVVGRLQPGVSQAQAQADMDAVVAGMRADHPGESEDMNLGIKIESMRDVLVAPARPALIMLLIAVGCVLLISCANVAGLLLARATVRQREISIRTALGASRGRLIRQMLTESALLGLVGGTIGVLLSLWLVDLLVALVADGLPKLHDLAVDGRVLGFTLALSIVTGLAFGLVPALHASRTDLNDALKETARSSAHARSRRARNALLTAEIAVALVLLVGAGLSLRSFAKLQHVDPGFRTADVVVAQVQLPDTRYKEDADVDGYYRRLKRQLLGLPGAESLALAAPVPFTQQNMVISLHLTGQPTATALPHARFSSVGPGYFATMGIPLKSGRVFVDSDDEHASAPVAVISELVGRRLFGGDNPVGKHITIGIGSAESKSHDGTDFEVIGVVGDVRSRSLEEPVAPNMYVALGRWPLGIVGVVARTASPKAVLPLLRQAMLAVDKDLPPPMLRTMESLTAETTQHQRVLMVLLGLFAAVALALASIGIYGVMSYTVTQRTREIGIRVALGAGYGEVLTLVLGESLRLSLTAIALGIAAALALGRAARGLYYGVTTYDPLTLIPVSLLILLVCLVASFLPARRATKVDPMVALRYE